MIQPITRSFFTWGSLCPSSHRAFQLRCLQASSWSRTSEPNRLKVFPIMNGAWWKFCANIKTQINTDILHIQHYIYILFIVASETWCASGFSMAWLQNTPTWCLIRARWKSKMAMAKLGWTAGIHRIFAISTGAGFFPSCDLRMNALYIQCSLFDIDFGHGG